MTRVVLRSLRDEFVLFRDPKQRFLRKLVVKLEQDDEPRRHAGANDSDRSGTKSTFDHGRRAQCLCCGNPDFAGG